MVTIIKTIVTFSRSFPVPKTKPASVFPIPVANWPKAPALHVWESVPTKTYPQKRRLKVGYIYNHYQWFSGLIKKLFIIKKHLPRSAMTFLGKSNVANTFIIRIGLQHNIITLWFISSSSEGTKSFPKVIK